MGIEQFSGLGAVGIRQGLQKPFGPGGVEGSLKIIVNAFQITDIEVFKVGGADHVVSKLVLNNSQIKFHQHIGT